ncbi:hypothetical protein BDAP_000341 [Binucleata daphniae]
MNFYEILQINKEATNKEIEMQYIKLIKSKGVDVEELKHAYEFLQCKKRRTFYNIFGDFGTKYIDTPEKTYIYTRIFTGKCLLLLIVFFNLLLLGTLFFPLALISMKQKLLFTKLTYYYIPFVVTVPICIFYTFYSFKSLKWHCEYNLQKTKKYIMLMCRICILAYVQFMLFVLSYDKIISTNNFMRFFVLPLPYIAAEILYLTYKRGCTIETHGKYFRELKVTLLIGGFLVRLLSMLILMLNIPSKCKTIVVFILTNEYCLSVFMPYKKHAIVQLVIFLYILGLYEGLGDGSSFIRLISLIIFYLIFGVLSIILAVKWEKYIPKNSNKVLAKTSYHVPMQDK